MTGFKRIIFIVLACLYTFAVSFAGQSAVMSVQVREGAVRQTPSFLGQILDKLDYGCKVNILEENTDWIKIAAVDPSLEGWMHVSALTTKEIKLKAGETDVETGATGKELALAGKGFDFQAENKFKEDNPEVDFTWVDTMEGFTVTHQQIQAFLAEGSMLEHREAL
ncbi:SH3 domain-containing protein [Thermodesulfobacteriota bacterium]